MKQLWILAGGNGAGKSTFYDRYLKTKGLSFVNADRLAKEISSKQDAKVIRAALGLFIDRKFVPAIRKVFFTLAVRFFADPIPIQLSRH